MSAPEESFWASLPLGRDVKVIAHDANGVAALAKPAGVLSHPNTPSDEPRSLLTARYVLDGEVFEWIDANGATQRLWLLNRLDSATSGVILASANGELATEIRAQFKRKQIRKVYHALVFGAPRQAMEVWRDLLTVEKIAGRVRTAATAAPMSGAPLPRASRVAPARRGGRRRAAASDVSPGVK